MENISAFPQMEATMTFAIAIKHCLNPACGEELRPHRAGENGRKFDECMSDFNRRATCNRECQSAYQRYLRNRQHEEYIARKRAEYPEKYCAYSQCGKRLIPRDQETLKMYNTRTTCGVTCSGARQRELANGGQKRKLNGPDLIFGQSSPERLAKLKPASIQMPSDEEYERFMLRLERMYT